MNKSTKKYLNSKFALITPLLGLLFVPVVILVAQILFAIDPDISFFRDYAMLFLLFGPSFWFISTITLWPLRLIARNAKKSSWVLYWFVAVPNLLFLINSYIDRFDSRSAMDLVIFSMVMSLLFTLHELFIPKRDV